MYEPRRRQVVLAALALVVVGTAVLVVGSGHRDPAGRGENGESRRVSITPDRAEAAPRDTGVARGGRAPRGQAPVVQLTFPRFQNAFNADASERRVLILLSPT
jgi:hypothetical protein